MYAGEMVDLHQLPHKMVAYSHCFRAEAGRGQHSHGIYRLHQFSKVEMLAITAGGSQSDQNNDSEGHNDNYVNQSQQVLEEFVDI